jgi:HNH endonuclease
VDEPPAEPTPPPKRRRKQFTVAQRRAILAKTAGRCYSCGEALTEGDDWWVEHIIPWANGGTDTPENLLPGCKPCNHLRLDHPPARFRLLLAVGDALVREMQRGSALGKQVEAFMATRESRQSKRRKHPHLGLRSGAEVIPTPLKSL